MNYKGLTRRSFILGLSALGLTGCGWHLRGKQNVPFKTIYIALGENSAVRATIRRNLEAQTEVKVVNDRKEAEAIFELLGQSRGSNVLAYLQSAFNEYIQSRSAKRCRTSAHDHGQRYPRIDSRRK